MVKFNVLRLNRAFMAKLGIHSDQLKESTNELYRSPKTYIFFFVVVYFTISSIMDILDRSTGFTRTLDAVLMVIAMLQITFIFLNYGLKMTKTKALQLKLQSIVDEGGF